MGSWSVYCSVSQVAITAGDECVLLPLKDNKGEYGYTPYLPATLPIFGKYDDYGGLEDIEEDVNTKLIEEHFGIPILDFTKIFTDWKAYGREEMKRVINTCKNFDELKGWKFMFIDRKVYDFMSTHVNPEVAGHLDFGENGLLEYLGFKYLGENENNKTGDPKRYCHEWECQGKKFNSDGTWLMHGKQAVYYFKKGYSKGDSLTDQIEVPEDKMWMGGKAMWQMWRHVKKNKALESLAWIIGKRRYAMFGETDELLEKLKSTLEEKFKDDPAAMKAFEQTRRESLKTIADKYVNDLETFGDSLAALVSIRNNMHCMSGHFAPFVLYLTPQCGEPVDHQILIEKFAEINKTKAKERGYYEDEVEDQMTVLR